MSHFSQSSVLSHGECITLAHHMPLPSTARTSTATSAKRAPAAHASF